MEGSFLKLRSIFLEPLDSSYDLVVTLLLYTLLIPEGGLALAISCRGGLAYFLAFEIDKFLAFAAIWFKLFLDAD